MWPQLPQSPARRRQQAEGLARTAAHTAHDDLGTPTEGTHPLEKCPWGGNRVSKRLCEGLRGAHTSQPRRTPRGSPQRGGGQTAPECPTDPTSAVTAGALPGALSHRRQGIHHGRALGTGLAMP